METKKPWFSKTILVNAVMGLCAAIVPFLPQAQVVRDFVANNLATIGIVWSLVGMGLRAITKGAIALEE